MDGSGGGTTTVTALSGNTVTGAGAGGMLFETVTFDDGGSDVVGGNTTIGDINSTTDVTGDGLRLNDVLGGISFDTLDIGNDSGTCLFIDDAGGKTGSFAFSNTGGTINTTNGSAMDIDPVTMGSTFASVSSTNANNQGSSGNRGINLDTVSGTVTINGGSITGAAGNAFDVNNSTANITYAGSITNTANRAVEVTGQSAGTVTFSGAIDEDGTGINLQNNTGGTISFSDGLDIDTGANTGFNATGGGTVNVTGSGNAVNTTTGTGINIANTTIGSVTFENISVSGGTNGIVLDNTGSSGSFTVTGDGSMTGGVLDRDGSGGTINSTIGFQLTNAHNVTLRQMSFVSNSDHAVEGTGGSDHVLSAVTIQNPTNHGWEATNLAGENRIDHDSLVTQFNGINKDGVRLINTDTDFTSFTVDNVTFSNSSTGNDGFFHRALGSTSGSIVVTDSTFTGLDADGVQVANDGSGTINTTIQGNTFTNADSTGGDGNNGLALNLGGSGMHQFMVGGPNAGDGNTFTDVNRLGDNSGVINVTAAGAGTGLTSQIIGTIQGNSISDSDGRRGISVLLEASGGAGHGGHTIVIDSNDVNDVAREGIYVGMSSVAGRSNTGNNITITDNNVGDGSVVSTAGNREGIEIETFHDGSGGGSIEADVLVQNNVVVTNNTDETFRVTNDAFSGGSTMLDVTVLANSLTNNNGSGESFEFRSWDPGSTSCLDINASNILGDRNNANLGYLIARSGGTFNIEGMTAGPHNNATVNSFVDARNDGGASDAFGDGFTGGVTCAIP